MKNKGITLISLVITIIILIILAGVGINLSLGKNGIFKRAKEARDKYLASAADEQEALNELYKELGMIDLPENTKENPQEAGKEVALKDGWGIQTVNYTNTKNGAEVTNLTKVATVYAVSVGNGDTVPVPKGFYYVGGNLSTGVIISDNVDDRYGYNPETKKENDTTLDKTTYAYTTKLKGNQFVFIPCTLEEYKKCNIWNGDTQISGVLANANWNTTTSASEKTQIIKYGGFYVARYEAGLANTIKEHTEEEQHTGSNQVYNKIGIPQSKAEIVPWIFIDWITAQKNAESMYNTNYVNSGLITGTQWDVMLNKISKIEKKSLTDPSAWGNYYNNKITYTGRYAIYNNSTNKLGTFSSEVQINKEKEKDTCMILTTGASENSKTYNIYDVAGNVWEWTEEATLNQPSRQSRVLRGGSCAGYANDIPACYRLDGGSDNSTHGTGGFRVVLYMK